MAPNTWASSKTGERRGMGTDLPVYVTLHDENGLCSSDFELKSDMMSSK